MRRAQKRAAAATAELDDLVLTAVEEGVSTRDIGKLLGLSHVAAQHARDRALSRRRSP